MDVLTSEEYMAKAQIRTPDGTTIDVEGTAREIAQLVEGLREDAEAGGSQKNKKPRRGRASPPGRVTPASLLAALVQDGFFKEPRDLGAVRAEFAAKGHPIKRTTLSPVLLRAVRQKVLGRSKEGGVWAYRAREKS